VDCGDFGKILNFAARTAEKEQGEKGRKALTLTVSERAKLLIFCGKGRKNGLLFWEFRLQRPPFTLKSEEFQEE